MIGRSIARVQAATTMRIYRRNHVQQLVQMVAKAIGRRRHRARLAKFAGSLLWRVLRLRALGLRALPPAVALHSASQTLRFTIICLISPMACAGFRPFGQVFAQFMIV